MNPERLVKEVNQILEGQIKYYEFRKIKLKKIPEVKYYETLPHLEGNPGITINKGILPEEEKIMKKTFLKALKFKKDHGIKLPSYVFCNEVIEELALESNFNLLHEKIPKNEISITSHLLSSPENIKKEVRKNLWDLIQLQYGFFTKDFLSESVSTYISESYKSDFYSKRDSPKEVIDMFHDIYSNWKRKEFIGEKTKKENKITSENIFGDYMAYLIHLNMKDKKIKALLEFGFRNKLFENIQRTSRLMINSIDFPTNEHDAKYAPEYYVQLKK